MRWSSFKRPGQIGVRALASAMLFAAATAGLAAVLPVKTVSPAAPPEALTVLNQAFRQAYADAKRRILAGTGPVIVVSGDTAVLLRNRQRTESTVNVPAYHALKTIAHVPLAIYVALTPGEGPLTGDRLKTLEDLRRLIPPARSSVSSLGLAAPVLARQDQILAESLAFLDTAITRRENLSDRLDAFTRRVAPLLMANVTDATRAQLDALHAQVSAWRREMGTTEWERVHVVIAGSHMARDGNVAVLYFMRLLHRPGEGDRIVYAESLWDEPRQLDLLATHLLDGSAGEAFFGEFMRMHRDLLSDAAREYLAHLLPE